MKKLFLLITVFLLPFTLAANEELFSAAEEGDYIQVIKLLNSGVSINTLDEEGRTLLQLAARNVDLRLVEKLLIKGADVDARGKRKNTPLIIAAAKGSISIVEALVEKGADVNAIGKDGNTALKRAVMRNHDVVVKYLLDKGATVDVIAENGSTALHSAVYRDYTKIAQMLLNKGADPTIENNSGNTPLDHAYEYSTERLDDVIKGIQYPVHLDIDVSHNKMTNDKFQSIASYALHKRRWVILETKPTELQALYKSRTRLFKVIVRLHDGKIKLHFVKGYGSARLDYLRNLKVDMGPYLR